MNNKLTKEQAYESMIHFLQKYHEEFGPHYDITDILSLGQYRKNSDFPVEIMYKDMWDEIVVSVENGLLPKRQEL
jgi:hypothetical protein